MISEIHSLTTTSFPISLYGQCCRRHVVGQRVVVQFVVVAVFVGCVLSLVIVICYHTCSLMYWTRLFCFTYQTQLDLYS